MFCQTNKASIDVTANTFKQAKDSYLNYVVNLLTSEIKKKSSIE